MAPKPLTPGMTGRAPRVSARLPLADAERLAELAARAGLNTSQAVRLAVRAWLERERAGPPTGG